MGRREPFPDWTDFQMRACRISLYIPSAKIFLKLNWARLPVAVVIGVGIGIEGTRPLCVPGEK